MKKIKTFEQFEFNDEDFNEEEFEDSELYQKTDNILKKDKK